MDKTRRQKTYAPANQCQAMHQFPAGGSGEEWKQKRHQETNDRVPGERAAAKRSSGIKRRRFGIRGVIDLLCGGQSEKHPHTKESEPAEKLNEGQLLHGGGHLLERRGHVRTAQNAANRSADRATRQQVPNAQLMFHQHPACGSKQCSRDRTDE
jgi:hypothetical protein